MRWGMTIFVLTAKRLDKLFVLQKKESIAEIIH